MRHLLISILFISFAQIAFATDYHVNISGNDASGNGTIGKPWRTLRFAVTKVPANMGHTIKVSSGTFVENGAIVVPTGINIEGAGVGVTILKSASSFHYNPATPGFGTDKFLLSLKSTAMSNGNQSIKKITIDGDGKKLHGGIFIQNRKNVHIESVKVQYVNFSGIWLWSVSDASIKDIQLKDCAWGSSAWCSAALQLGNTNNIDVSNFNIDENKGYGIKNLGQTENTSITNMKLHDGRVSVAPSGVWNNGSAPNISIEFWASSFPGTEIYNCYVDNHISLVNYSVVKPSTPLKIYNNVFDILGPRANGRGYCMELSIDDVEVSNNWFNGGSTGIVNWGNRQKRNWNIHHNTFYGIASGYPSAVINFNKGELRNANIHNNTIEMVGTATINFIEINNGGKGDNISIKNNLIINSNTSYKYYPNRFISLEKGSTISNLQVTNNLLHKLPIGNVPGTYTNNNLTADPKINKTGSRPAPYYVPATGSPLIGAGTNVGLPFSGTAPTIGAHRNGNSSTIATTGIIITPSTLALATGATTQLTTAVSPSNATNKNVSFKSNNTAILTVNATGLVTALTPGSAIVTATTADGGKTATSTITVSAIAVSSVTLSAVAAPLPVGSSHQLTINFVPSNAANKKVTWKSSNSAIVSVSATGVATAIASGSATITATTVDGNKMASTVVTVNSDAVASSTLDLDDAKKGNGINQFTYHGTGWTHGVSTSDPYFQQTVSFANAISNYATLTFIGNKIELYSAKAPHHGIAAVSVDNGPETYVDLYSPTRQSFVAVYNSILTQGTHTIKIRTTGIKNTAASGTFIIIDYLKVYSDPTTVSVAGIVLTPANVSLHVGSSSQLTTKISPENATNKAIIWNSSNVNIATVTNTGLVKAISTGSATITAKSEDGGKIATSLITTSIPVSGVTLSAIGNPLNIGDKHQLTATLSPVNATLKGMSWVSSNPEVIAVNASGQITAVGEGNASIIVTTADGKKTATALVAVTAPVQHTFELDDAHRGTGKNQFSYVGSGWTHGTSTGDPYLHKTVSYSNTSGNYATLAFTGNKVELFSAKASHHGIFAVSIDNGAETLVDLYSASRQNFAMVFSSNAMTEGNHTIKIRVTGTKNPAASGTYTIIDYLKVYSESATSVPAGQTLASVNQESEAVPEPREFGQIQIYPNPIKSGGVLNINLPEANGEVIITDVSGFAHRTISVTSNELQIPLSDLPKGMYFLQYRNSDGKSMSKIMVD